MASFARRENPRRAERRQREQTRRVKVSRRPRVATVNQAFNVAGPVDVGAFLGKVPIRANFYSGSRENSPAEADYNVPEAKYLTDWGVEFESGDATIELWAGGTQVTSLPHRFPDGSDPMLRPVCTDSDGAEDMTLWFEIRSHYGQVD